MKKTMMILVTIMMLGLTACGNKQEEANVTITERKAEIAEEYAEDLAEEVQSMYTEEYVEKMKLEAIIGIAAEWEEFGISEDCKDEIIKLIDSIEYDQSFDYGYDLVQLQIDLVNILVRYGNLPEECYGMTFDEIPAGITINEF